VSLHEKYCVLSWLISGAAETEVEFSQILLQVGRSGSLLAPVAWTYLGEEKDLASRMGGEVVEAL